MADPPLLLTLNNHAPEIHAPCESLKLDAFPQAREYPLSNAGEDIPMTLQVALIGMDGFVLASDTKMTQVGGDQRSFRSSSTTTKLSFNHDQGVAWCWTGDRVVGLANQKFSDLLQGTRRKFDDIPDLLRQAAKDAWQECFAGVSVPRERISYQRRLTVIKSDGEKHLGWMLDMFESPDCQPFKDKAISGDAANLASFFVECFYPSKKSKALSLKFLAASVILFGGRLNPTGVGGLEMVVCSEGKLIQVNDAEIIDLEKHALELHSTIQKAFFAEINC